MVKVFSPSIKGILHCQCMGKIDTKFISKKRVLIVK